MEEFIPAKTYLCRYFEEANYCRDGDKCPFSHVLKPYRSPDDFCRYYFEDRCFKGDLCKRQHSKIVNIDGVAMVQVRILKIEAPSIKECSEISISEASNPDVNSSNYASSEFSKNLHSKKETERFHTITGYLENIPSDNFVVSSVDVTENNLNYFSSIGNPEHIINTPPVMTEVLPQESSHFSIFANDLTSTASNHVLSSTQSNIEIFPNSPNFTFQANTPSNTREVSPCVSNVFSQPFNRNQTDSYMSLSSLQTSSYLTNQYHPIFPAFSSYSLDHLQDI